MTKKNEFCVNDKKRGSCWGKVKTWDEIDDVCGRKKRPVKTA